MKKHQSPEKSHLMARFCFLSHSIFVCTWKMKNTEKTVRSIYGILVKDGKNSKVREVSITLVAYLI